MQTAKTADLSTEDLDDQLDHVSSHVRILVDELSRQPYLRAVLLKRLQALAAYVRASLS